jgi:phospholipase/carboxylesterase
MKRYAAVAFFLCLYGGFFSTHAMDIAECNVIAPTLSDQSREELPLPVRKGLRVQTSGRVPHVQLGVEQKTELIDALHQLAYSLPDLEKRPTIVSISGSGMWLANSVSVSHPKAIVSGREFAHIHPDGSLHAPFSLDRAIELEKKGWGERHPWADRNQGWEGLVMLYSASSEEELETLIQLVTESYNFITGRNATTPAC